MQPYTFITDFERTENSDVLHAVLGRALIIATRFDAICKTTAVELKLKRECIYKSIMTDEDYENYTCKILKEYSNLAKSIKSIDLPDDISVILRNARIARNSVAHDLTKGFMGCLDNKIDKNELIREVSELVMNIAYGDIAISLTISLLNHEPVPNAEFISSYKDRIVRWVVET